MATGRSQYGLDCNSKTMAKTQNTLLITIAITLTLIVSTDFWSYLPFQESSIKGFFNVPLLFFFIIIVLTKRSTLKDRSVWDKIVLWVIISYFLSSIPAYFDFGQSLLSSFWACLKASSVYLMYYVLRITKYPQEKLVKIVLGFSIVWVFLELFQQLTYPSFWFSGRYLRQSFIEERMGMMRFYLFGIDFVLIAFSFYLGLVTGKHSLIKSSRNSLTLKYVFLFILTIGIFCYLSRKHMAVAVLAFMMSVLNTSGRKKWIFVSVLGIVGLVGFYLFWTQFSDMNAEMMDQQSRGEDFIRILAANYYLTDFSQSTLYPILGSGMRVADSGLDKAVEYAQEVLHFYQADCGIIGYYSRYGLFGVSAILTFIVFFIKKWNKIESWLRYFFVMRIFLIFFDFWGMWVPGNAAFAVFLYFVHNSTTCNEKLPTTACDRTKIKK